MVYEHAVDRLQNELGSKVHDGAKLVIEGAVLLDRLLVAAHELKKNNPGADGSLASSMRETAARTGTED